MYNEISGATSLPRWILRQSAAALGKECTVEITKRRVIVLSMISVILLVVLLFYPIVMGTVRSLDGVNQNSRVYMEDVVYENGVISFSVINKTFRRVACMPNPYIQRCEDGEWIYVPNEMDRTEDLFFIEAFSVNVYDRAKAQFAVQPEAMIPGEYRLISGAVTRKGKTLELGGECYIVGYFTVSE